MRKVIVRLDAEQAELVRLVGPVCLRLKSGRRRQFPANLCRLIMILNNFFSNVFVLSVVFSEGPEFCL